MNKFFTIQISAIVAVLCLGLALFFAGCNASGDSAKLVRFATGDFQLTLAGNGQVESFVDKRNGDNYAKADDKRFCVLRLSKEDVGLAADKMTKKGHTLTFSFPGTQVTVKLHATTNNSYLIFDVLEVAGGDFYSLQFARIPLTIDYNNADFAACAMSRNMNTITLDYPGKSNMLGGQCFKALGSDGAGVFLLGTPEKQMRETMKKVVDSYAHGMMPVSRAGGPYAMDHPKNYGSYIINSEPVTEQQVDEWVTHLSRFGINQIDFHQGTPFRQGDFHFNEKAYPNGVADFRKTSEAFRKHGFVTGLHTYAEFIAADSKYITPVPSKDLDVMRRFTLALDLDSNEQNIVVNESTADVSEITGFFVRNSKIIRIDDELIKIEKPSRTPPYGFTSCTRGMYGTKVSAHAKGAPVDHLTQMFGLFAPNKDSELFLEIARETARTYNEGGFGMIYLDALDGTYTLVDDKELTWYYEALFVNEILKHVQSPPLLEYSTFSHNLWYGRSRMGAWDSPHRGYQRFFDRHIETNRATADRLYLPGQMGWLALCPSAGDNADHFQYHILFRENVEYLGAKILANNYGLSYLDIQAKSAQPFAYHNGEILKNYDSLRLSRRFSAETIERLRDPHAHFLLQHAGDDWYLTEAYYEHVLLRPEERQFSVHNPYPPQTPMIRIEHRHQPMAYESPEKIELLPFDERQPAQKETIREFEQPVDLTGHLGLGVWIYGDGGGQRVIFRIESSPHLVSGFKDHILKVDFTGWRYFAMAEADNGIAGDTWPCYMQPCENVYEAYRQVVHFNSISKVQLLIEGDATNLRFRTLRALPLTERYLIDPTLQMDGQQITFRGKIKNGHYMEYIPGGRAVVYDATGNEVSEMQPDTPSFKLPAGAQTLRFSGSTESGHPAGVRVTLRTQDTQPLR